MFAALAYTLMQRLREIALAGTMTNNGGKGEVRPQTDQLPIS